MTSLPDHFRSRDVIFCHVIATSCGLQQCTSSNVPKTWLTSLLRRLPGDFRSNDVTSGSLPVTRHHFLSRHQTEILNRNMGIQTECSQCWYPGRLSWMYLSITAILGAWCFGKKSEHEHNVLASTLTQSCSLWNHNYLCTLNHCKIKWSRHSEENDKAIKDNFCQLKVLILFTKTSTADFGR